jgi:hypothetical protein
LSASASSSIAAISPRRPSRCATAAESRSPRLFERVGGKDRPDQRAEQAVLVLAGVTEAVAREVDRAARPSAAQDLRDRGLQAGMRVAERELDANQAALDQTAQEARPEPLGLGLADIKCSRCRAAPSRARHA